MVEFTAALIAFIVMAMCVVDFGRAIYQGNAVSEAAREIARVTSVHPGTTLGNSVETSNVVARQKSIVWNLGSPAFACVDIDGTDGSTASGACLPGMWVKVTIAAAYTPITPALSWLFGSHTLASSSSVQIP